MKKELKSVIRRKVILKYSMIITLLLLIGVSVVLFVQTILVQYGGSVSSIPVYGMVILVFLIGVLNWMYENKYNLPYIDDLRQLDEYLSYFANVNMIDLTYVEAITWFARIMRIAYLKKLDSNQNPLYYEEVVNRLYRVLRFEEDTLVCAATRRKTKFKELAKEMEEYNHNRNGEAGLSEHDRDFLNTITYKISTFKNEDVEKYHYIDFGPIIQWFRKHVFSVRVIIVISQFGASYLQTSVYSKYSFLGIFAGYIVSDIIAFQLPEINRK